MSLPLMLLVLNEQKSIEYTNIYLERGTQKRQETVDSKFVRYSLGSIQKVWSSTSCFSLEDLRDILWQTVF